MERMYNIEKDKMERLRYFKEAAIKKPFQRFNDVVPLVYRKSIYSYDMDVVSRTCIGVLRDNTPIVGEIWRDGNNERLTVIMPKHYFSKDDLRKLRKEIKPDDLFLEKVEPFIDKSNVARSITHIKDEEDDYVFTAYILYLVKKRVICFVGDDDFACVSYGKDMLENDVVIITIDLKHDGVESAVTSLPVRFRELEFLKDE